MSSHRWAFRLAFTCSTLILAILATPGCRRLPEHASAPDDRFPALADEFVRSHFDQRPLAGVALGWHQYDGRHQVPDAENLSRESARLKRFATEFNSLSPSRLSVAQQHDLALIRSVIALEQWVLERQRAPWRNPMTYAGDPDISIYLKRDFKSLDDRVTDITSILRNTPAVMEAARKNLEDTLPRPFVETAIESAEGSASFLEGDVSKAALKVTDEKVRAGFEAALKPAVQAFRAYANWLKTEKLPRADQSFAVGRDAYIAMLKTELIEQSPEQILEIGMRELRAEQKRFAAAAAIVAPGLQLVDAAKIIQRDHPTAAGLIPDTVKNLESIRQFVLDRRILTMPSEVRARVEETLPPFRATSFASMDTPGPFETRATEAYYYVTPVEPHWSAQQAEEWLSAFNYYTTDVVSIHEAYPGHYVQFLALNHSPASAVAKVFSSYAFTEGWAHYTEQMMLEEGFGQPLNAGAATPADRVRGAKYQLAQSIEALLRLCRLVCSIRLHTQGMTVDQATRFFVENSYYEEKPARSEATRGTYDPGYLYYTLGKLMILKLREDWKVQEGARFSLQRFHDEMLRHGAPPLPLLRRILLQDPALWEKSL